MTILSAFATGLVFGLGLLLSGMTDPAKVLAFLDITGHWDPSLALVMGGAIGVGLLGFAAARRRSVSLLGAEVKMPTARHIDCRLIGGSVVFGIGWGVAGFCPGPALVALAMGHPKAVLFVAAMLAGMVLFEVIERRRRA